MFNLSGSELIFLVLIALVVLGPDKLPEAMRKAGKAYADFKKMTNGFQSEMKSVLEEPMRELRETAELAKKSAMWDANDTSPPAAASNAVTKPVSANMADHEPRNAAGERAAARAKAAEPSISSNAPPLATAAAEPAEPVGAEPAEPAEPVVAVVAVVAEPVAPAPADIEPADGDAPVAIPAALSVVSADISPGPVPIDEGDNEPDEVASA